MELELRHLRIVCAIAEAGNISRAAAALGISQPSLTGQLQRIERELRAPLFVRTSRGVTITALGELIAVKAGRLLPLLEEIRRDAATHLRAAADGRALRYAATPGPLMVGLLDPLKELFPRAEVSLRGETDVAGVLAMVGDARQDLASVVVYTDPQPDVPDPLGCRVVAEEPAFVLVAADHPHAGRGAVELAELADAGWVVTAGRGNGLLESFTRACGEAGFRPSIRHEGDASAARELVAAGKALGLGQATFRSTPGVVPLALRGSPLRLRHLLVWHAASRIAAFVPHIAVRAHLVYAEAVHRSPHYLDWLSDHPPLSAGDSADR